MDYIERSIVNKLQDYLGGYLHVRPEHVRASILAGRLDLQNVPVRREAFNNLNLPVDLLFGHIGRCQVILPFSFGQIWSWVYGGGKGQGTKKLKILLDRLFIVLGPREMSDWSDEGVMRRLKLKRQRILDKWDMQLLSEVDLSDTDPSASSAPPPPFKSRAPQPGGWRERLKAGLMARLKEGMEIQINNIHIRYEDKTSSPGGPFSCGVTLLALRMLPTDSDANMPQEGQRSSSQVAAGEGPPPLPSATPDIDDNVACESASAVPSPPSSSPRSSIALIGQAGAPAPPLSVQYPSSPPKKLTMNNLAFYWNHNDSDLRFTDHTVGLPEVSSSSYLSQLPHTDASPRTGRRAQDAAKKPPDRPPVASDPQAFLLAYMIDQAEPQPGMEALAVSCQHVLYPASGMLSLTQNDTSNAVAANMSASEASPTPAVAVRPSSPPQPHPSSSFPDLQSGAAIQSGAATVPSQYVVDCNLQSIEFYCDKDIFRDGMSLLDLFGDYNNFVQVINDRMELYYPYRPTVPIKGNAYTWWRQTECGRADACKPACGCVCERECLIWCVYRYAIGCVRRSLQQSLQSRPILHDMWYEEHVKLERVESLTREYRGLLEKVLDNARVSEDDKSRLEDLKGTIPQTDLVRCHVETKRDFQIRKHVQRQVQSAQPVQRVGWRGWLIKVMTGTSASAASARGGVAPQRHATPLSSVSLAVLQDVERVKAAQTRRQTDDSCGRTLGAEGGGDHDHDEEEQVEFYDPDNAPPEPKEVDVDFQDVEEWSEEKAQVPHSCSGEAVGHEALASGEPTPSGDADSASGGVAMVLLEGDAEEMALKGIEAPLLDFTVRLERAAVNLQSSRDVTGTALQIAVGLRVADSVTVTADIKDVRMEAAPMHIIYREEMCERSLLSASFTTKSHDSGAPELMLEMQNFVLNYQPDVVADLMLFFRPSEASKHHRKEEAGHGRVQRLVGLKHLAEKHALQFNAFTALRVCVDIMAPTILLPSTLGPFAKILLVHLGTLQVRSEDIDIEATKDKDRSQRDTSVDISYLQWQRYAVTLRDLHVEHYPNLAAATACSNRLGQCFCILDRFAIQVKGDFITYKELKYDGYDGPGPHYSDITGGERHTHPAPPTAGLQEDDDYSGGGLEGPPGPASARLSPDRGAGGEVDASRKGSHLASLTAVTAFFLTLGKAREQAQKLTSEKTEVFTKLEVYGDLPELSLALSRHSYDTLIRVIRLLLTPHSELVTAKKKSTSSFGTRRSTQEFEVKRKTVVPIRLGSTAVPSGQRKQDLHHPSAGVPPSPGSMSGATAILSSRPASATRRPTGVLLRPPSPNKSEGTTSQEDGKSGGSSAFRDTLPISEDQLRRDPQVRVVVSLPLVRFRFYCLPPHVSEYVHVESPHGQAGADYIELLTHRMVLEARLKPFATEFHFSVHEVIVHRPIFPETHQDRYIIKSTSTQDTEMALVAGFAERHLISLAIFMSAHPWAIQQLGEGSRILADLQFQRCIEVFWAPMAIRELVKFVKAIPPAPKRAPARQPSLPLPTDTSMDEAARPQPSMMHRMATVMMGMTRGQTLHEGRLSPTSRRERPVSSVNSPAHGEREDDEDGEDDWEVDEDACLNLRVKMFMQSISLVWVEEATGLHFAKSEMKTSTLRFDLGMTGMDFQGELNNFTVEDLSSAHRPTILGVKKDQEYILAVHVRSFDETLPDFQHHLDVDFAFASIEFVYLQQKFLRLWRWIFEGFLPSLTASDSSDSRTHSGDDIKAPSNASSGSPSPNAFRILKAAAGNVGSVVASDECEDGPDETSINVAAESPLRSPVSQVSRERREDMSASLFPPPKPPVSPSVPQGDSSTGVTFVRPEASTDRADSLDDAPEEGQTQRRPQDDAREGHERTLTDAADGAHDDAAVEGMVSPGLTKIRDLKREAQRKCKAVIASDDFRLLNIHVRIERPIVRIPRVTGSKEELHLLVREVVVSNAPLVSEHFGVQDVIGIEIRDVQVLTHDGETLLGNVNIKWDVHRPLSTTMPPAPMWMVFTVTDIPFFFTSPLFAFAVSVLLQNIVGDDPDIPARPLSPLVSHVSPPSMPTRIAKEDHTMRLQFVFNGLKLFLQSPPNGRTTTDAAKLKEALFTFSALHANHISVDINRYSTTTRISVGMKRARLIDNGAAEPFHIVLSDQRDKLFVESCFRSGEGGDVMQKLRHEGRRSSAESPGDAKLDESLLLRKSQTLDVLRRQDANDLDKVKDEMDEEDHQGEEELRVEYTRTLRHGQSCSVVIDKPRTILSLPLLLKIWKFFQPPTPDLHHTPPAWSSSDPEGVESTAPTSLLQRTFTTSTAHPAFAFSLSFEESCLVFCEKPPQHQATHKSPHDQSARKSDGGNDEPSTRIFVLQGSMRHKLDYYGGGHFNMCLELCDGEAFCCDSLSTLIAIEASRRAMEDPDTSAPFPSPDGFSFMRWMQAKGERSMRHTHDLCNGASLTFSWRNQRVLKDEHEIPSGPFPQPDSLSRVSLEVPRYLLKRFLELRLEPLTMEVSLQDCLLLLKCFRWQLRSLAAPKSPQQHPETSKGRRFSLLAPFSKQAISEEATLQEAGLSSLHSSVIPRRVTVRGSEEQLTQWEMHLQKLSIMAVNDFPGFSTLDAPFLDLQAGPILHKGTVTSDGQHFVANVELSAWFFNPIAVEFEPVLETCKLEINAESESISSWRPCEEESARETSPPKLRWKVQCTSSSEPLRLNLSSELLQTSVRYLSHWVEELKETGVETTQQASTDCLEAIEPNLLSSLNRAATASFDAAHLVLQRKLHFAPFMLRNETGMCLEVCQDSFGAKGTRRSATTFVESGKLARLKTICVGVKHQAGRSETVSIQVGATSSSEGFSGMLYRKACRVPIERCGCYVYNISLPNTRSSPSFQRHSLFAGQPEGFQPPPPRSRFSTASPLPASLHPPSLSAFHGSDDGTTPVSATGTEGQGSHSVGASDPDYIVCRVAVDEETGQKTLSVQSQVMVRNETNTLMAIAVNGEKIDYIELRPSHQKPIPVNACQAGRIAFRPLTDDSYEWSRSVHLERIWNAQRRIPETEARDTKTDGATSLATVRKALKQVTMKGSSRGLRNSSPSRADFHLHMTSEAHVIHYHGKRCVQWHLTLRAPIRIRSTLPIPCSYQINSHVSQKPVETSLWSSRDSAAKYRETQFTHSGSLVTNCTEHIHSLELQDRVTLQLCLFGAQFRGQVIIYHRNPAGRFTFEKVQAYRCLDVDNRVTEVEVINESPDPNAPPDILVHVPVWLVNYADPTLLSDQPLAYDLGLLSRRSPSPPSSLSINDVDPQSIWLDYDVDMVNYLTDQRVNGVAFRGRQPEPPEQDSHALVLPMDAKMERVAVSVKGNAARSPYINTRKLASDGAICVRVPDEAGKLPDARLDFGVRVVQCPVPMVREVKLLYLSFRYYLVNDLPCHLEIKQASTDAIGLSPAAENIGIVAPGSERPFFWPDYTKPLELSIRIQGSGWRWSGTIPVNRIGEWTCRLRRDTESANVRILIATSQGSCFIRLREERADLPDAIKIVNSTSLPIRVKQGPPSSRLPSDEVASGTEMFFGWHEYPSKRVVSAIPVHSDFAGLSPSEIDLTSTETKQIRLQDPGRGKPLFAYTYQVQQKGNLKYLTFSTASTNASDRKVLPSPPSVPPPERDRTFSDIEKLVTDTPPVLELSIELENVVLSLICRYPLINPLTEDHEMHNNELLLISFEGIHFLYARSHPVSGMLSDSVSWLPYEIRPAGVRQHRPQEICSFTVQDLQIDCQSSDAHFPVILYRCPPSQGSAAVLGRVLQGQLLDRTTIQSTLASRPILHLSYKRHLGFPELAYFEAFRLAITDILCRVDSRLVSDISLMLEQYKNAFEQRNQANDRETASLTAPEQSPVKQSSRVQSRPWEPPALVFSRAENVSKLYFEDLNVRPIFLLVSYSERSSLPSKSAFFLPRVARSVLTSVDSAPFWLSAFQAQHQALEVSVLVNQIKDHYYWQLTLWGASAGLLSLEFFGNPIGLVGAVLESASDLIYKPFESVAREGLFALPQGIASGVTSAFFGTLSTTGAAGASVAGTFSQTLGAMSLDDKFVHSQREDVLRNRPRTIMDTFVAAGSTGLKGIAEGLTGFVRQPAEGFSETGIEGFVTGLVKGTAGLVFKPTAASLNAVQKLFIGIQDVAATAELKQRERRRLPRVLYGSDRLLKPYNEKHAIVKSRLAYVEAQCWSYLPYQCILPDERRDCVYLITDSLLLQVDVRSSSTRFRLVELYKIESVGGRSADRNRRASFMVPFSLWAQPSDRHENPVAQATELTVRLKDGGVWNLEFSSIELAQAFESHLSSCLDITI